VLTGVVRRRADEEGTAMAYWVRAICTADTVPTIRSLRTWLRDVAGFADADVPGERPKALDSAAWKSFELVYDPARASVLVECHRNTGPRSLCARELREELEALDGVADSEAKRRVVDGLSRARFVICCTVAGDPRHREAFKVRSVLDYFVDHCGAMLDTEDEGFYSCSDLPLLGPCAEG
jgi:hypothetical protein